MPFKIVQTVEANKKILTVVPSKWEHKGILFWPTSRNDIKLIHNENSDPKDNWQVMPCTRKREFATEKEAECEIQRMENASETECDYDSPVPTLRTARPRKLNNTHVLAPVDLNVQIDNINKIISNERSRHDLYTENDAYVEEIVHTNKNIPQLVSRTNSDSNASIPSISSEPVLNVCSETPVIINVPANPSPSTVSAASASNQQSDYVFVENAKLNELLENQNQIKTQLAILQASVDFLMQNAGQNVQIMGISAQKRTNNIIRPLKSYEELKELEGKLSSEDYFEEIINSMTFICGSSNKSKGIDSCYKLIDYFFERELILNCSWTGTSRHNGEEGGRNGKIALKYFYKTRKCFLTLVRKSDDQFSETDCDKFFKTVIKNAKQRLNPKITSTTKYRLKKAQEINNKKSSQQLEGQQIPKKRNAVSDKEQVIIENLQENQQGNQQERQVDNEQEQQREIEKGNQQEQHKDNELGNHQEFQEQQVEHEQGNHQEQQVEIEQEDRQEHREGNEQRDQLEQQEENEQKNRLEQQEKKRRNRQENRKEEGMKD